MICVLHPSLSDAPKSRRAFESLRDLDPYRILDMEVYSTLLWHTEKHIDLSFLAQELLSIEPRSPQTWIAIGNCFSLQKDKKQALTCFGRATQLDPGCAYAYTLAGHELVDTRIDQAINYFQSGIRADPRHYNAWCVILHHTERILTHATHSGMGWVHAI